MIRLSQEPASTPLWQTFVSSLSGVWRGVGAAFSPITAEMEAIALGDNEEMLYDCRIHSTIAQCQGEDSKDWIHRKTIWAVGNPLGENNKGKPKRQETISEDIDEEYLGAQLSDDDDIIVEEFDKDMQLCSDTDKAIIDVSDQDLEVWDDIILEEEADTTDELFSEPEKGKTADLEREDLTYDTVMEEDVLELEPGLVLFEVWLEATFMYEFFILQIYFPSEFNMF